MALCLVRGSINIDEFFYVNDVVLPGQTISSTGFERRGGGKGANQAAAVARAGGQVQLVGAIGDDGTWLVNDLKSIGVDTVRVQKAEKEPTGRAIIQLTPAGENCIILHKGANFARADSPEERTLLLSSASYLLLQNEIPPMTTIAYLQDAAGQGVQTVYNPSPMPSDDELREFPWASVSYLLVNEGEARALLRAFDISSVQAEETTREFLCPSGSPSENSNTAVTSASSTVSALVSLPAFASTVVVCTLGGAGVLAAIPRATKFVYLPAASLQGAVRDTTGAGDCFAGYFVAGLMRLGKARPLAARDIAELLRFSAQAAGMCVERRGAMESIPARTEVEKRALSLPALNFKDFD